MITSIVYLRAEQISDLFESKLNQHLIIQGEAFSMDQNTVFHAFTASPKSSPAGIKVNCRFYLYPSDVEMVAAANNFNYFKLNSDEALIIFLSVSNNVLKHKCFLKLNGSISECEIKFIPGKLELYSRSKGLLEVESISKKSVGIVGLGSGGSPIAVELAKAGIGNFTLIDFDRLELSNVSRHVCGVNDLGRFKTYAVRDLIWQKNPYANVITSEIDVNVNMQECANVLSKVDIIICASDNDRSRFFLNELALKFKIPAIFGRAITRAIGGDVLRVRPFKGPCYNCLYSQNVRSAGGDDEEISQEKQAKKLLPDYTNEQDLQTVIQVGLASDIAPISNFMVKLALVELSKGENTGIKSLEEDLISDFYIWANRREKVYESWSKLEFNFNKPSILRWYGARVERDPNCMVCGI